MHGAVYMKDYIRFATLRDGYKIIHGELQIEQATNLKISVNEHEVDGIFVVEGYEEKVIIAGCQVCAWVKFTKPPKLFPGVEPVP